MSALGDVSTFVDLLEYKYENEDIMKALWVVYINRREDPAHE